MKIDIYKSTKNGNKYLSVPAGKDVKTMSFPTTLDKDVSTFSPFKTSLEIQPGDHKAALDCDKVIEQIQKNGYAVHEAKIEIKIASTPQPQTSQAS